MSYHYKFIIPLLDENLTLEDLNPKSGFIDFYTDYINDTNVRNCMYLLYKKEDTTEYKNRINRFKNLKNLKEFKQVTINGESHIIYSFVITNDVIYRITNGMFVLMPNDKLRVIKFWNFTDTEINEYTGDTNTTRKFKYSPSYIYT